MKKHTILLKSNETLYHDKVPISTRFYLQLLKKSQFRQPFIETEKYDYASENEKATSSMEGPKNIVKNCTSKNNYNLRSGHAKTERKILIGYPVKRARKKRHGVLERKLCDLSENKEPTKEQLAPLIKEIKSREVLKTANKNLQTYKNGAAINKIAEKLHSLIKDNQNQKLDHELLYCKETFDKINLDSIEKVKENGK